jgi:hypothetical protein
MNRNRIFGLLCLAALVACATAPVNRRQPAQTMGEGQFKLAAS